MGVGKGATVGHFSARVDRWVGSFSLGHNLMGAPLPDCIELIKGQAQRINVFVTGRAIWILGVSFQFLTNGRFGAVRGIGFDRVDVGRRGRGRFSKKSLTYPYSTMNRAVTGTIRSESKYGTGGEESTPIVLGSQ